MAYVYKIIKEPLFRYEGAEMELVGYAFSHEEMLKKIEELEKESLVFSVVCWPDKNKTR